MENNSAHIKTANKPDDWPQNRREMVLSLIDDFCDDFIECPSFVNKERLIALTTFDSPSHDYNLGLTRFTEYEAALINSLYLKFKLLNFQYGITFLYTILFHSAHTLNMVNRIHGFANITLRESYQGLLPCLHLWFCSSLLFFEERKRSLADELLCDVGQIEQAVSFAPKQLAHAYNSLLFDLSCMASNRYFRDFDFPRVDLAKLLAKSAHLMKRAKWKQTDRPHRGLLCMTIANFILKSRNNDGFESIYKCVPKTVFEASFSNMELWMRRKSELNDKREGRAIKEIFSNRSWIKFEWAKTMKFTYERESFTCSFSKERPNKEMKEKYGDYVYGYHYDTIAPSIATLIKTSEKGARLSQVVAYDVLYSRVEFKDEINYLLTIIDGFDLTDDEKRFFLEQIIDYWKLTIKDKRWANEKERRYEIMHFDDYEYVECSFDDTFLKNKTPLLLYPDFVLGPKEMRKRIRPKAIEKARFQNLGDSQAMCRECLFRSFSFNRKKGCLICGCKEFEKVGPDKQ